MKNTDHTATLINIKEHFEDSEINLTEEFDLIICAESLGHSVYTTGMILCNIESEKLLKEISEGRYDEIDLYKESLFNNNYQMMIKFLNL